jgi:hypothetical protein
MTGSGNEFCSTRCGGSSVSIVMAAIFYYCFESYCTQFLKMECDPARVEIARKTDEIRLTLAGLEWCDARCVKHVWRHNSETY